jgi:hypothetical protein
MMIAQFVDVEIVAANAAAECGDQRADLGGLQHLVEARLLDVEDLALQRQDCLRAPVAPLLGGSTGRVALDDEDFAQRRIFLLAVGEFAGQACDVERALAPRHLARLSRGLAGPRGVDDLADDGFRFGRVLEQKLGEARGDGGFHHALHFRRNQLFLGLRRELRIG